MAINYAVFALIAVFQCVATGASGVGKCPKHEYLENFNVTRFTGDWFELERSFYLMELISNCMTMTLTENSKGQIHVSVKTVGKWSGIVKETHGIASIAKRDPSMFTYRINTILPNALARFLPGSGTYQVLDTDYDNFAVLWTCSSVGIAHTDMVWILGRRQNIEVNVRANIYDFLTSRHIDTDRLIASSKNCLY